MLWTSLLLRKGGREITVIFCDRVMILAFCTSSDDPLSMYQDSFNSLLYFQRYAPDKLIIAKIKKGSNPVNTGDRVIKIHSIPFYTFRDMPRTSLLLQKLGREITVIFCDRVMILAFCTSPITLYHCIKVHLILFYTFRDMLRTSLLLQKLKREVTPKILVTGL